MEKKKFKNPLDLRFINDDLFQHLIDFSYASEKWGLIIVPARDKTDGASIPRFLWVIVGSPWSGKYPRAAVVHDRLCRAQGEIYGTDIVLTKKQVDQVFLEIMKYCEVSKFKRYKMYSAVRLARGKFDWENKVGV